MTAQHRRRPSHGWRLLAAGLAALTVGALATVSSATPAHAAAPHAGTRAQIPWSRVGAGWTLATWAKSEDAPTTLFLVAPDGHRWSVATFGRWTRPTLWSPDGRRAIVQGVSDSREVDLHTGRSHVVSLPAGAEIDSYSRPRGLALLVAVPVDDRGGDRLERFDTYGHHQQSYPTRVLGAGSLYADALETPDGAELVVGAQHGLVLLRNNGTVVRRLAPKGRECSASSWWTSNAVLAECEGRLWSVPISGGEITAVSAAPAQQNVFGYADAWRYSRGRLGLGNPGCGPRFLVRFDAAGNGTRVNVPLPDGRPARATYVGHHGDVVDFVAQRPQTCGVSTRLLMGYNAVTGHSKALLGPGVNGGTVIGAADHATR